MPLVNAYPGAVNAFNNPGPTTKRNASGFELDQVITQLQDAAEAEEAELGAAPTAADILRYLRIHDGVSKGKNVVQTALRNVLIHGDPPRQQEGDGPFTSTTTPANNDSTYIFDAWYVLSDGNDIVDLSVVRTGLPDGARGKYRLDIETANKKAMLIQIIENADIGDIIEAGCCSLSWDQQRTGTSINGVRAAILGWNSTADSPGRDVVSGTSWGAAGTLPTLIANWSILGNTSVIEPTTSWVTNVLANIAVANTMTNLAVAIWIDDLTTTVGDFLELTNICLVPGPVPVRVPRRSAGEEQVRALALYEIIGGQNANELAGPGVSQSTTSASIAIQFFPKRRIPTPTIGTLSDWQVDLGTGSFTAVTGSSGFAFSTRASTLYLPTTAAVLTAGRATQMIAVNTNARIRIDARF